jgi:glycosyltransferase involved in cell wall biosynthesis
MEKIQLKYEHIIIDNNSNDGTIEIVSAICENNKKCKLIINNENYGQVISPIAGILSCNGDAVIVLAADFENPVDKISDMINAWLRGNDFVIGIVDSSDESNLSYLARRMYYKLINFTSHNFNIENFNGFCLIDKKIINWMRDKDNYYLFLRSELFKYSNKFESFKYKKISRKKGFSKNNFLTLLDIAVLGIISNDINISKFILIKAFIVNSIMTFIHILGFNIYIYILLYNFTLLYFVSYFNFEKTKFYHLVNTSKKNYKSINKINF